MSHPRPHFELEGTSSGQRYRETVRVTLIGSVIDFLLGVTKIGVGLVAHSQALIADGVHSLSDLVTDFIVLYAAKHARHDADEEHPYGHGRIETIATVGLGVLLILAATGIAWDAIRHMLAPDSLVQPGFWALVVAAVSVVSKEAIYQYTMVVARKYKSKMQGRGSCLMWRPGWLAGIGMLAVTSAIVPSKPFSIRSSMNITRRSQRLWQSRAGNCQVMCNANSKIF